MMKIINPGPLSTVQDGGRFGYMSTGFGSGGATVEDVQLFAQNSTVLVKASGGIRDAAAAAEMIKAGASRIGTSAGITIVEALV